MTGGAQGVGFEGSVGYPLKTGKPDIRFFKNRQNTRQTGKPDFLVDGGRKIDGKPGNRNSGFSSNLKIAGKPAKLKSCRNRHLQAHVCTTVSVYGCYGPVRDHFNS